MNMARPSLFTHRKFRTLARRLGSRALAVGSLELLWAVANDAGDPLIGTPEDVEDVADWKGEAGQLVAALVTTRFLDETPDGLMVHDHGHHCPSYVRRRRDRERARRVPDEPVTSQRRASGAPLDSTPNSHLPTPISQDLRTTPNPVFDGDLDTPCAYCGATARQTKHALEPDHFIPRSAGGSDEASNILWACHRCNQAKGDRLFASVEELKAWLHRAYWTSNRARWIAHRPFAFGGRPPEGVKDGFDAFWARYPRKVGKPKALAAYRALKVTPAVQATILAALDAQCTWPQWTKDNGEFIPHPATWLHRRGWEDEPPKVVALRAAPRAAWTLASCPHEPKCGGQWKCAQRTDMDALRREG